MESILNSSKNRCRVEVTRLVVEDGEVMWPMPQRFTTESYTTDAEVYLDMLQGLFLLIFTTVGGKRHEFVLNKEYRVSVIEE